MIEKLRDDVKARKWKTEVQEKRLKDRLEKIEIQLKLQKNTRDYNLGTSLRNYIDPRVMRAWMSYVKLDWKKMYTATLQRKFKWVENSGMKELRGFYPGSDKIRDQEYSVIQEES
jgi:DNA topoisomerase-1